MVLQWDVFISHASEDKDVVARPLAQLLQRAGLRVWLDEQQLDVGDSLRAKIDAGLAGSRFGVLILSPSFLAKLWPAKELDGLVARERKGYKVILPVWYEVDQDAVAAFSPTLAGVIAAKASEGLETVAASIAKVVLRLDSGAPGAENPSLPGRLAKILDSCPPTTNVASFLRVHKDLAVEAFASFTGEEPSLSGPLSLAGTTIDLMVSQLTPNSMMWKSELVLLLPLEDPVFLGTGDPAPALANALESLQRLRRWLPDYEGRPLLRLDRQFVATVLAGRRHLLGRANRDLLARLNESLTGISVRTYDYLIDVAVKISNQHDLT